MEPISPSKKEMFSKVTISLTEFRIEIIGFILIPPLKESIAQNLEDEQKNSLRPERSELKTTIREMNVPVAIGISKAIKEKGFKQTYVAESAGYTPQELSDMLNGRRLIKACDIPRIAKALGVEINYLFGIEKGA